MLSSQKNTNLVGSCSSSSNTSLIGLSLYWHPLKVETEQKSHCMGQPRVVCIAENKYSLLSKSCRGMGLPPSSTNSPLYFFCSVLASKSEITLYQILSASPTTTESTYCNASSGNMLACIPPITVFIPCFR